MNRSIPPYVKTGRPYAVEGGADVEGRADVVGARAEVPVVTARFVTSASTIVAPFLALCF
jgi:hypothetical protein